MVEGISDKLILVTQGLREIFDGPSLQQEIQEAKEKPEFDGIIWLYRHILDPYKPEECGALLKEEQIARENFERELRFQPNNVAYPNTITYHYGIETYIAGSLRNILGLINVIGKPKAIVATDLCHSPENHFPPVESPSNEEEKWYAERYKEWIKENNFELDAYKRLADTLGIDFRHIPLEKIFPEELTSPQGQLDDTVDEVN